MDVLPPVSILASATVFGGVAKDGAVPWGTARGIQTQHHHLLESTTSPDKKNVVIVGWKTWLSHMLPSARCIVVVLTKRHAQTTQRAPHVHQRHNLVSAITEFSTRADVETIFIGGGPSLWGQALQLGIVATMHITRVLTPLPCDTFFPDVSNLGFLKVVESAVHRQHGVSKDADVEFQHLVYRQVGDQFFSAPTAPSVETHL
jgi:dihydrofolate reductase